MLYATLKIDDDLNSSTTHLGPNTVGDLNLDDSDVEVDIYRPSYSPKKSRSKSAPSVLEVLTAFILPFIAILYLSFCFIVHYKLIPLNGYGYINTDPKNITSIKAGIATISILILTLGLYPLQSLIQELHGEEFFRAVSSKPVPLATVNSISSPASGTISFILAIIRKQGSPYLTIAIVAGFISTVVSSLAPAARTSFAVAAAILIFSWPLVTINTGLFGENTTAFPIAAINSQSVYNASFLPGSSLPFMSQERAASIAWAETSLGLNYSFSSTDPAYIIPSPLTLATKTPAQFLTDVIHLSPSCSWASPSQPILQGTIGANFSTAFTGDKFDNLNIQMQDLLVTLSISLLDFSDSSYTQIGFIDPEYSVRNMSTLGYPSDGMSAWMLASCTKGCTKYATEAYLDIDFTALPTLQLVASDISYTIAFLVCTPGVIIETLEVRNDGTGSLSVITSGPSYNKQGNLHPTQTPILFSTVLTNMGDRAGPDYNSTNGVFGTAAQMSFLFNSSYLNITSGSLALRPMPLNVLTQTYQAMISSAGKSFMDGSLGRAYVPGRTMEVRLVFASSLGHVIASAILLFSLSVVVVGCLWRSEEKAFTLVNIAGALAGSSLPEVVKKAREDVAEEEAAAGSNVRVVEKSGKEGLFKAFDRESDEEGRIVKELGGLDVSLQPGEGVLQLSQNSVAVKPT